jgi:Tfp pilus assembly protein PilN
MPKLAEVHVPEDKKVLWDELGGAELDPVLGNGAVLLLSSEWMMERAESQGALLPRQALRATPREAQISRCH